MVRCLVCNSENPRDAKVCAACGASLAGDPAGGYASALPAGTQLNGGLYAVGKVLGQGGFGITYLGSDARARRVVAIKEFFPHGSFRHGMDVRPAGTMPAADFNASRDKFLDEALVLKQFQHPGIVNVYDTFTGNNTAYYAMEYLRGRSLLGLLEETGPVPEYEAVQYATRVGDALEVVHAANLLHRDIKPDNVMLTDDGRLVLIDFGNARTFAAGKTGRMTTQLTPGYAPLEQYSQYVRFGPFTDVYAFGAMLYHLLTGQMPADATDRATGAPLPPPRELQPTISRGVSDAIVWAMAIRVDERPQTVRAFLDALQRGLPGYQVAVPPAPTVPRPEEPVGAAPPPRTPAPPPVRSPRPRWEPDLPESPDAPDLPEPEFTSEEAPDPWSQPEQPARRAAAEPISITIAGPTIHWPGECACCFQPADARYSAEHTGGDGPFFLFEETRSWDVPYCSQCLEHVRAAAEAPGGGFGRVAAGSLLGAALGGPIGLLVGLGGAAASTIFNQATHHTRIEQLLRPTCVALGPAVAYTGWHRDTHSFLFLNQDYVDALRAENADSIVE